MPSLTRSQLLTAVQAALQPLPHVQALWQGGAAAFNRVDDWSDIDLMIAVDDDHVPETVATFEVTLTTLSPITLRYELPPNNWHGHWQAFYQLERASPFLMLDVLIMKRSATNRFLETEIHGQATVHFDKIGFTTVPPIDRAMWQARLKARVEVLRVLFPLFQPLVLKELHRHNHMEAVAFYQAYTVRPLVELLRIQHTPFHYDFYARYLYSELPPELVARLEPLFFLTDAADLSRKREQAEAWFNEVLGGLVIE